VQQGIVVYRIGYINLVPKGSVTEECGFSSLNSRPFSE